MKKKKRKINVETTAELNFEGRGLEAETHRMSSCNESKQLTRLQQNQKETAVITFY